MNKDLKNKIFSIIKDETGIDFRSIDPTQDFRKQVSLDSVQLIDIAIQIEKELGAEIPITVMEVSTMNDFLSIIDAEINKISK